jgi:molybdopterin molybdotransferase
VRASSSMWLPLEAESVSILEALGRVLCVDVLANAPIPPHDNSAMDGYAVRHADLPGIRCAASAL